MPTRGCKLDCDRAKKKLEQASEGLVDYKKKLYLTNKIRMQTFEA